LKETYVAEINE